MYFADCLLEFMLVITACAILMLQAAGFLIMLKTELKPILDNARETTRLSKATAQFINSNAVDPVIQIKSFLSGLARILARTDSDSQSCHIG